MALVIENEGRFVLHLIFSQKLGKGIFVERFHEVFEVPSKFEAQLQSSSLRRWFESYSVQFLVLLDSAIAARISLGFLGHF